jgi:DNA-binding PadR family transcriptional regulator
MFRWIPQSLQAQEDIMDIDNDKVDEITLALLHLTTHKDKYGLRAWKSHSWDVLDRLHERGYIHEPATKAKSVMLTEEGAERSKRLFEKHFTRG